MEIVRRSSTVLSGPFDICLSQNPLGKKAFSISSASVDFPYHICRYHSFKDPFVIHLLVDLHINAHLFSGKQTHHIFSGMCDIIMNSWKQGKNGFPCSPFDRGSKASFRPNSRSSPISRSFSPIICSMFLLLYSSLIFV